MEIQYQVIVPIKESNKGKVCLAKVEGYDFPVIVKELKHGNIELFHSLRELESDYVPQIYDVKESSESLLIVEEYIEGELLSEYLTAGRFSEAEWLDIAGQLCQALSLLHNLVPPIIHRDIKPSNVIIDSQNKVKLIDFDSSRLYKEEAVTDTRLLGTERYAPPEQYGFSQTDNRSDIYSLGVVLGMFPEFASATRQKRWKQMVEKCTLFAPESRFQSAEEILKEIERVKKCEKNKKRIGMTICGGILLFGLGAYLLLSPVLTQRGENEAGNSQNGDVSVGFTSNEITPSNSESSTLTKDTYEEDLYRTVAPEWRDVEADSLAYLDLKKEIREHNAVVMYCFKDRLDTKDFLLQNRELERVGSKLQVLELENIETGNRFAIEANSVEVQEQLIWIDAGYMQAIEDGYYRLIAKLLWADGSSSEHTVILYVAESDPLEEPALWLQNTTLSFYGTEKECTYAAIKNDSSNEIASLLYNDRTPVEKSLYRILYDGRALEFSNQLLSQYPDKDEVVFFVIGKDGSEVAVRISICCQE